MANKRRQLEEMIAKTNDSVVRMQLTKMLNEELQQQNWIMKKVTDALDSLFREIIGLVGKRNTKDTVRDQMKINPSTRKRTAKNPPKKGQKDTQKQPEDLAEIIAIWPKLPEYVKAAITDIVHTS